MADRYTNTVDFLMFELTNDEPKVYNTSETLMFELRSYHEGTAAFASLLDFVEITGGVF